MNFKNNEDSQKEKTTQQFLEDTIRNFPKNSFQPYAYYNQDRDVIEVYFKDESCYTKPFNSQLEFHQSFENDEIVGVNILNARKLLEEKGKFQ